MRPSDWQTVRGMPLFAGLTTGTMDRLAAGALVQALPRGAMLCVQGEMPEHLHLILGGRVALVADERNRDETVVEFFEAGDVLIAPAVMLDAPYLMSARVVDDSRIMFIGAEAVRHALHSDREFATAMALQLARYWRRLIGQIKDLKLHSATERLAVYLIGLATQQGGAGQVALPEDRKVVAARLGMTAESLSRAFAGLRDIGVGGRGRTVTIADLNRLRAYVQRDELN